MTAFGSVPPIGGQPAFAGAASAHQGHHARAREHGLERAEGAVPADKCRQVAGKVVWNPGARAVVATLGHRFRCRIFLSFRGTCRAAGAADV